MCGLRGTWNRCGWFRRGGNFSVQKAWFESAYCAAHSCRCVRVSKTAATKAGRLLLEGQKMFTGIQTTGPKVSPAIRYTRQYPRVGEPAGRRTLI